MSGLLEIFQSILGGEQIRKLKTWERAVGFLVFKVEGTCEPTDTSDPVVAIEFVNKVIVLFELKIRLDVNARIERFHDAHSGVCWQIASTRLNELRFFARQTCEVVLKLDFEKMLNSHIRVCGLPMYK